MTPEQHAVWLNRLLAGERRALARLLTLAESHRPEHGDAVNLILQQAPAPQTPPLRVGVTGIPGAGKSTLIDELGCRWVSQGHRVAVLAVDPSSILTGGSVLGDKLRMTRLSRLPDAFIRPIPSAGTLGGVSAHLDDCARLCELAGYDRVVVETVGVGQSELDVALVCDVLISVVVPGTGDEVQAMKRGLWEVTDVLAINKADRETEDQLHALVAVYRDGLGLVRGGGLPVVLCSARTGRGLEELGEVLLQRAATPSLPRSRKREALFRRLLEGAVVSRYWARSSGSRTLAELTERVREGSITLRSAVETALGVLPP